MTDIKILYKNRIIGKFFELGIDLFDHETIDYAAHVRGRRMAANIKNWSTSSVVAVRIIINEKQEIKRYHKVEYRK